MESLGLSPNTEKLYRAMKSRGVVGEENMESADVLTYPSLRMAKNHVMNALQEMMNKGIVKRKAREKSSGYYIVPGK